MQKLITNKRAQALIEFVLVLPILIMLLFSIIDFGTILIRKSELENKINEAYEAARLTSDVKVITPGLNLILGSPHKTSVERVVLYEKQ